MTRDEQWLFEEKYDGRETVGYDVDTRRLASGEPLAYVIGWQPFLGLKIHLDSKPLIPRPETEWWTEQFIAVMKKVWPREARLKGGNELRFLDLCAGSGAIGCAALAKLPSTQVYFGEIDPTHKITILKNIRENNLDAARAFIRIGDLFEPFAGMTFDVIAANPPYVPASRILPASVADYEPAQAFYAGTDGLDVIRRIAAELPQYLSRSGEAWIECDRGHTETTCALFKEQGFNAVIRTDQYEKPRIVVVSFP